MIWLDPHLQWHGCATGKRGRSPTFSEAAIQFFLTMKCLFGLALRQAIGMVQSLLKLAGLDWPVPDYSTVCRRQRGLTVEIGFQRAKTGLHLLVDGTGIKVLGEGEWKTRKHGADDRRQWRKVHLDIDAQTLEIRAIEVTDSSTGDAPMLPCLLDQIPSNEPVLSVSGDGAYDTRQCHEAISQRQAEAVIPCRKNARPWRDNRPGAQARNEIARTTQGLGRVTWKKWSGYHRRSLVEAKMNCFKRLGERVMARDFERQVAELQVRAAILNRFTRLDALTTVRVA